MKVFSRKFRNFEETKLKLFFANENVIFEPQQYAYWRAKSSKFTAVFYESGKLVIQGSNIEDIVKRLALDFDFSVDFAQNCSDSRGISKQTTYNLKYSSYIGVDESGKGDFFGPLIVAGVCVTNETKKYFIDLGIKDSKKLSDRDILELAGQIKSKSVFSVITINPLKYNELYLKLNNLNRLLAWGHARAIENVLDKYPCEYAISDKFADESLIQKALMKQGQKIVLEQKIKAESDIAVAAASVVARACFVQKIEEMSYKYNMTFPKGASHNVKEAGKFFVSKFGKENLKYVAKLHFKTTLEL